MTGQTKRPLATRPAGASKDLLGGEINTEGTVRAAVDPGTALHAARSYADRGWHVLPIPRGQKYPRFAEWQNLASVDDDLITTWWERWPDDGVGIACGAASGIIVVDVDVADGKVGLRTLRDLETRHDELPETYTVRTPTGGWHYYFRFDPERPLGNGKLGADIDTRGEGGQVLAPPTLHPIVGTSYVVTQDVPLADLPEWAYDILLPAKTTEQPMDARPTIANERANDGPADRYNEATTWEQLLTADGWAEHHVDEHGVHHWTRPGKDKKEGASATTMWKGKDFLKVFTSSVAGLEQGRAYSRFGYYAATRHGGDLSAAATQLLSEGFRPDPVGWISDAHEPTGPDGFHYTDDGNSERLVANHGDAIRYVTSWGQWLVWDGTRWVPDPGGVRVTELAKDVPRQLWKRMPDVSGDERKALRRWATATESARAIDAMVRLARGTSTVGHDELDADPWLLNVANGVMDLRTGDLLEHHPDRLMTKMAGTRFDPAATAPTWDAFLRQIMPDDELRAFLQAAVGYSLTGDVGEQVLFLLIGDGANGKSTLVTTLTRLLGDYAAVAPKDLLLATRHQPHPTGLTDLHGARFVPAVETEAGARFAEAQVKQLTGGDPIKARRMRQDHWQFDPTHKLWLAANHRPRIAGEDHAIWRRIRLVPFTQTIAPAEQDPALLTKLGAEFPGILNWALAGCAAWQANGLQTPDVVTAAVDEYRADEDWLQRFIDDKDLVIGQGGWLPNATITDLYRQWCNESGETPVGGKAFTAKFRTRGCEPSKRNGLRGLSNIDKA
jgi:putative DNA primase/helicase